MLDEREKVAKEQEQTDTNDDEVCWEGGVLRVGGEEEKGVLGAWGVLGQLNT